MLFTTEVLGKVIGGAILYEETPFQSHPEGVRLIKKIEKLGILPDI